MREIKLDKTRLTKKLCQKPAEPKSSSRPCLQPLAPGQQTRRQIAVSTMCRLLLPTICHVPS